MKWISVKKRLPKDGEIVLVCEENITNRWTQLARYIPEWGGWHNMDNVLDSVELEFDEDITHWMPLPEPPDED